MRRGRRRVVRLVDVAIQQKFSPGPGLTDC